VNNKLYNKFGVAAVFAVCVAASGFIVEAQTTTPGMNAGTDTKAPVLLKKETTDVDNDGKDDVVSYFDSNNDGVVDAEAIDLGSTGTVTVLAIRCDADGDGREDDWAVVNAIAEGNAARALVETSRRFDRGDSPHAMLGQLRWWVSARLAPVEPGRMKAAVEALLRTDLALKSSGGDDRVLVERLVVELTGRPLPAQKGRW